MLFSETVKAHLAGARVRVDVLIEFHFASGVMGLWNGKGELRSNDGRVWYGTAAMGGLSGLAQSVNGSAPTLEVSLSGVDPAFALKAKAEAGEYYNQPLVPYLQFFDDEWQPLDNPYGLTMVRMSSLKSVMAGGENGRTYTVGVSAESPFAVRRRPPFGYLTDRDQQLRHPGDRGLERMPLDKTITWPAF